MGSGIGSILIDGLVAAIGGLLQATIPCGFKIAANSVPLSQVEQAWPNDDSTRRTVFITDVQKTCNSFSRSPAKACNADARAYVRGATAI